MGSKNAADNAFRAVVETMNMNSDDSDYCLLASKTLVNITARGSQYKNNNSSSSSSSSVRWRDVVDSAEEALWIHQDKISAYDTMCAVLLNVYARYVHEILPAWDKRALCVCHVVDILRYYRGNPTICAMSVAFLDAMLEESNGGNCSSTGCTPSDEVRFLLWQEGVPKLLGSALMIHEGNTGLYNSINSIIAKIGDHVFSDWLQCIGASKVPYKKEFPFSEVAAMSKSKLMFNGIFYYAVVMDKAARYNLWRSAGFIISKPDSPLYWERFVTTSVATETAPARTIATTEADGSSGEAATESASQSPVRALAPPSGGDGSDSDFNKVYAILLENKEFFASVLGETPEDFTESVEKALRYVSYLLACKETSAKMSAWGLTKSDILAVTFYRLDFASTLLQHSARFSAVLNAFVAQSKASKSTLTPITLFYEALKRALVKIPPYEGKVYRVFLSESRQDLKALAKAGTPFAWNALVSATTNFDAAKRLCININYILAQVHVRRSHRIDLFTPFPALHDECEVLTLPTSAFRVTKDMYWDSENKMYYVDIEEI